MATNLRKLTQLSQWKPRARERAIWVAIVSGPLALLIALLAVVVMAASLSKVPAPVNTYTAIADTTKVQNYARNALLLWLGGNTGQEKPLLARNTAERSVDLSNAGFEVFSVDPAGVERHPGSDAVEWVVTLSATLVVPGSNGAPQVSTYAVTVLDRDGSYQLLTWPRIANPPTETFTVSSKYTVGVEKNGPLGKALDRFVVAYLTSVGSNTSLGQYVSAQFAGAPIANTPYSSVEIESIKSLAGSQTVSAAKPGDTLSVLVRVKAGASVDTWSVMDLPLRVSLGDNNIWLVDGFDNPVRWGPIGG